MTELFPRHYRPDMEVQFMKCKNCKTENILKADYCKNCGQQFTESEKKKAYNRTVFGIIDNILNLKSYITFDFITGNKWFKLLSLLILILYSALVLKINGSQMKILDNRDYDIEYNKTTKEYYLVTDKNELGLDLYIPETIETIQLATVDENNSVINEKEYNADENVTLSYSKNSHYVIRSGRQKLGIYIIMK